MIKSMTGYGRAREVRSRRDITVEVRSVNNRYLDCNVKLPRMYAFTEDAVKKHVQQAVSRGKVDVFITVDATAADVSKVAVNRPLAAQYAAALEELAAVCGTADYRPAPEVLARFPDVLTVTKEDEDLETVSADLCAVLDAALASYNAMRAVEGGKLAGQGTPAQILESGMLDAVFGICTHAAPDGYWFTPQHGDTGRF